jgi:hypothetical protein
MVMDYSPQPAKAAGGFEGGVVRYERKRVS